MAICTRCAQAAAEAAEISSAQRIVVDAILVVEAGVGRHLMSSRHHRDRPRWRASQRGRWRRQWWRSRWWSVELHAQAAARTLRAVVAPEAPLRAALLRRGAAGRCGSQGEAARPWRRLRPRERGGGGALWPLELQ